MQQLNKYFYNIIYSQISLGHNCTHGFSVAILWPGKKRLRNLSTVEILLEEFPKLMKLFTLNHEILDIKETLIIGSSQ